MKTHISRLLALLMTTLLLISVAIPAFAVDAEGSEISEQYSSEEGIMPLVTERELREIPLQTFTGTIEYRVTPEAGANLWLVMGCSDGGCEVKVYKGNSLFATTKFKVTATNPVQVNKYKIITDCNGGEYKVKFHTDSVATIAGSLVQTN